MSLHPEENAVTGGQLDSLATAGSELSLVADLSRVSLSFSPMKQFESCPAGREVVFVCTYGPISL